MTTMKNLLFAIAFFLSFGTIYAQQIFSEDFQTYEGFGTTLTGGWTTSGVGGFKVYIRGSSNGNIKICEISLSQNKKSDSLTTQSFGPLTESASLSFTSRLLDSYIGTFPGFRHVIVNGDKVSAYISQNGGPFQFLQDLLPNYPTSGTDFGNFTLSLNGFASSYVKVKFVTARTSGDMIPSFDNFIATNITSTKPLKTTQELSLYPNPSNGHSIIKIESSLNEKFMLSVFDVTGRIIQGATSISATNAEIQIDMPGTYLVELVNSDGDKSFQKLIVR